MISEDQKPDRRRPRKGRRILFILIPALVVLVAILSLTLPVGGYAVGYGNVAACRDPLLRASQKGPIVRVLAEQDESVSKGQLIIQLDDSLAKVALAEAERDLAATAGEIQVFKAECELAEAQRQYQQAQAELRIRAAKQKLDRLIAGNAKGTVSPVELAQARLEYQIAALEPLQTYEAQAELEEERMALLEQQLQASHAQVELSKQQLASLQVQSPIDGRVVLNPLVVGEVVDANKILGRVFDETSFTIQTKFPERLLYLLQAGQQADVYPAGQSRWARPLNGRVVKITRLIQPQETGDGYFWVTIALDQQPLELRLYPGQDAQVCVNVGRVSLLRRIIGL